jgi:hypothetical protein
MGPSPTGILQQAIRAVPSVKYALGVAGVASAGALVIRLVGYDRASIIIIGGTFVAMILLYVFSAMVASKSHSTVLPGIILLYMVIFFFCSFLLFTVTAFAFNWPPAWLAFIGPSASNHVTKTANRPAGQITELPHPPITPTERDQEKIC